MKRHLCVIAILFASLGISALGQKTKSVPKNLSGGETVYYISGEKIYHEKMCPEIAGKNAWGASALTLIWRKFEPCPTCLYKEVPIGPPPEAVVPVSGVTGGVFGTAGAYVAKWKGAAPKSTESFAINTNEWEIRWTTVGDSHFIFEVYNADTNEKVEPVENLIEKGAYTTVMRGKGRYYLKIETSQYYAIVVTEKK